MQSATVPTEDMAPQIGPEGRHRSIRCATPSSRAGRLRKRISRKKVEKNIRKTPQNFSREEHLEILIEAPRKEIGRKKKPPATKAGLKTVYRRHLKR